MLALKGISENLSHFNTSHPTKPTQEMTTSRKRAQKAKENLKLFNENYPPRTQGGHNQEQRKSQRIAERPEVTYSTRIYPRNK